MKKKVITFSLFLMFICPLLLVLSASGDVKMLGIYGTRYPGYERNNWLGGGERAPGGNATCNGVGKTVAGNPFFGWPTTYHAGDWNTVTAWYCDPNYFVGYTHWGIDLGRRSWEETIRGAEAVATAIVARVQSSSYSEPFIWNSGMGNFVKLEAYQPVSNANLMEDCDTASNLEARARADRANGVFDLCWEPTGWVATYMHLLDLTVETGDVVFHDDVIGHIDTTGNSTGDHLHYQINTPGGGAIDPAPTMAQSYQDALRGIPWGQR